MATKGVFLYVFTCLANIINQIERFEAHGKGRNNVHALTETSLHTLFLTPIIDVGEKIINYFSSW